MPQPVVLGEAKDLAVARSKRGRGGDPLGATAPAQPPEGPSLRSGQRNPAPRSEFEILPPEEERLREGAPGSSSIAPNRNWIWPRLEELIRAAGRAVIG